MFLHVSPMYIIEHFVQFILHIPEFFLLALLSCLLLLISLTVLVLVNFSLWLDKLFSTVVVREFIGRIMCFIFLKLIEILLFVVFFNIFLLWTLQALHLHVIWKCHIIYRYQLDILLRVILNKLKSAIPKLFTKNGIVHFSESLF